mgnify:CR=1 FL=1
MKRIRFASCLMVLFLLVLNLEIALGQEQSGIDAIPQDFADHSIGAENADGGYVVNLVSSLNHSSRLSVSTC